MYKVGESWDAASRRGRSTVLVRRFDRRINNDYLDQCFEAIHRHWNALEQEIGQPPLAPPLLEMPPRAALSLSTGRLDCTVWDCSIACSAFQSFSRARNMPDRHESL